jgi:O-antigen/teichoic acid export membrane protein
MRAIGRPGVPAIAEGIGLVATVALLLLLLPALGIVGAAIASLAAYSVVAGAYVVMIAYQPAMGSIRRTDAIAPPGGDLGR